MSSTAITRMDPAQRREIASAAMRKFVRYRMRHYWDQEGRVHAVLVVALPGGNEMVFTRTVDPMPLYDAVRARHPQAVGGFLGKLWKGVKKVAKGVASSGVFKAAANVLAVAAPVLGPLAPAALAASAGMKGATMLLAAKAHSAAGNSSAAATLVSAANAAVSSPSIMDAASAIANKVSAKGIGLPTAASIKAAATQKGFALAAQMLPAPPAPTAPRFNAAAFAAADWTDPKAAAKKAAAAKKKADAAAAAKKKASAAAAKKKADNRADFQARKAARLAARAGRPKSKAERKAAKAQGAAPLLRFSAAASPAAPAAKSAAAATQQVYALLLRPAGNQ